MTQQEILEKITDRSGNIYEDGVAELFHSLSERIEALEGEGEHCKSCGGSSKAKFPHANNCPYIGAGGGKMVEREAVTLGTAILDCISTPPEDWEKEFDDRFNRDGDGVWLNVGWGAQMSEGDIKSFIKSTIEKEREKIKNEMSKLSVQIRDVEDVGNEYWDGDYVPNIIELSKMGDIWTEKLRRIINNYFNNK